MLIDVLVALPPARATAEPNLEPSMLNCTVPVGVPEPGAAALTVTVKLTDWFRTEGLAEEVMAAVEPSLLTVWARAAEVLPLKFGSPP